MIDMTTTLSASPVRVSRDALRSIAAHARATRGRECCGALLGRSEGEARDVVRALPIANEAADARTEYMIGAASVRRAERHADAAGLALVGFYHSHPNGSPTPSWLDVNAAWPWFTYLILAGTDPDEATGAVDVSAWRLRPDRSGFDREQVERTA